MIHRILSKYRRTGWRGLGKAIVQRVLRSGEPPFNPVPLALETLFADGDFTIVQIGAYIGDSDNDPLFGAVRRQLRKGKGRLICVEPVRAHFDALVENYRDVPNVICENVAIAEASGPRTFYRLDVDPVEHGYPAWLSQLGSLKKERMESLWDRYEADERLQTFYLQHRREEVVQCTTLLDLLRRHHIGSVDLLQIDTEGYEWEILATIDFSRMPIRFVNYECVLLQEHRSAAERFMRVNGYSLMDHGQDTFCFQASDERIVRRSKKLRRAAGRMDRS